MSVNGDQVTTPWHRPLTEWLGSATEPAIRRMGAKVLAAIDAMHGIGLCHRDLHRNNLLVDGDRPLIIDIEHACQVEPAGPCYDLTGPCPMIPLLPAHAAQWGRPLATSGVWWDAPQDTDPGLVNLGKVFGPLHGYLTPQPNRP